RRERWYARLAHAARWHVEAVRHDVHPRLRGGLVDARQLVVVEVRLLDGAAREWDVAVLRERQPHDGRAFHLRAHALGMHAVAAVHRRVDARDADLALVTHHHMHDRGDIGDETSVRGDAKALPLGQLLAP